MVKTLINDIGVVKVDDKHVLETGTKNKYELEFKDPKSFVRKLKEFTFKSINRSDDVQLYEKTGEKIIKGLFDALSDKEFNRDNLMLPVEYRRKDTSRERNITDFIAGMMDTYAINYYKKIYGENSLNQLYDKTYFEDYKY